MPTRPTTQTVAPRIAQIVICALCLGLAPSLYTPSLAATSKRDQALALFSRVSYAWARQDLDKAQVLLRQLRPLISYLPSRDQGIAHVWFGAVAGCSSDPMAEYRLAAQLLEKAGRADLAAKRKTEAAHDYLYLGRAYGGQVDDVLDIAKRDGLVQAARTSYKKAITIGLKPEWRAVAEAGIGRFRYYAMGVHMPVGTRAGEETRGPDGGTMVWVPPGEFPMGGFVWRDGGPVPICPVRITRGFWIGKCEVSNGQYSTFCRSTGRSLPAESYGGSDYPVVSVSWKSAMAYCQHYGLRLPTEAEWEYSAAGPQGLVYPWGNDWDATRCCTGGAARGPGGATFPVDSLYSGASWCGALHMAGNVWEWCATWCCTSWFDVAPVDPEGPRQGTARVVKGSSWAYAPEYCRAAAGSMDAPNFTSGDVGFRVCRVP